MVFSNSFVIDCIDREKADRSVDVLQQGHRAQDIHKQINNNDDNKLIGETP